jgi:LPXTG-site transpeptidase (sortase) family protein
MSKKTSSPFQTKYIYLALVIVILSSGWSSPGSTAVEAVPLQNSTGLPIRITDLNVSELDSFPHTLTTIGNQLFFIATEDTGKRLYKLSPPYQQVFRVSNTFVANDGINPDEIGVIDGVIFYSGKDDQNGIELWRSDPPYITSQIVADINPDGDSYPKFFKRIGNTLFFQADDGSSGFELWKTQPPYTSATRVADIFVGSGSSSPHSLVSNGWLLFFSANNSVGRELWKSEPPYDTSSTTRVSEIFPDGDAVVDHLIFIDNTLFFNARENLLTGFELWKSTLPYDKTSTVKVNDLESWGFGTDPQDMVAMGDTLFFTGNVFTSGNELHKTKPKYDTTTTFSIADINPGFFSSNPNQKVVIGSTIFFSATDGREGYEIWKSESPQTEAIEVADINPTGSSLPQSLTAIGSSLFFSATDGVYGHELYRSDPPYNGVSTRKVAEINQGSDGSYPSEIKAIGSTLFFSATDGEYGYELWKINVGAVLPSTGFAPNVSSVVKARPEGVNYAQSTDMILEIPQLAQNLTIVGVPEVIDGWNLDWLGNQAGYLYGTAYPTWQGNSVITGHVYLPDGKPGPFINLKTLKYDDRIIIHAWNQQYIYQVRSITTVAPDNLSILSHENKSWLTLLTCQDYNPADNDYLMRLAVRAVLTAIQ